MKYLTRYILISFVAILTLSCSARDEEEKKANHPVNSTLRSDKNMIISGVVETIQNGKDGYVADIKTQSKGIYAALVSIVNLGGPENFVRFNVGDKVTVSGTPSMLNETKQLKVEKIIRVADGEQKVPGTQLLITETSFRGITVGDQISSHSDYIQKEQLKTGEGSFEIYRIKDFNNNPAGYFMADPNNESLVADITVESPMAATAEGIKVGSTFEELRQKLPDMEVHGSEIEGRTYANYNNLSYRLDIGNFTYEVDIEKIPAATKIINIVINRG